MRIAERTLGYVVNEDVEVAWIRVDEDICILRVREEGKKAERSRQARGWKRARTRARVSRGDGRTANRDRSERRMGRERRPSHSKRYVTHRLWFLSARSRFPSSRYHGFHGVLVIIRTFRPPSTFASRPPPAPTSRRLLSSAATFVLVAPPASRRRLVHIPYNRYVTL